MVVWLMSLILLMNFVVVTDAALKLFFHIFR